MLERLQESLADIEQLKADLLSTVPPPKHTALPAAVVKKKRKAHSMAHGLRQDRQSKATPYSMLTLYSRDSQGENECLLLLCQSLPAVMPACNFALFSALIHDQTICSQLHTDQQSSGSIL